jgi:hypothetical protein
LGLLGQERKMPAVRDKEVNVLGVTPRAHVLRKFGATRIKWPWKSMVINDYFVIEAYMVEKAKNAVKSFRKKVPGRRFSIRPQEGNIDTYVVRRVA